MGKRAVSSDDEDVYVMSSEEDFTASDGDGDDEYNPTASKTKIARKRTATTPAKPKGVAVKRNSHGSASKKAPAVVKKIKAAQDAEAKLDASSPAAAASQQTPTKAMEKEGSPDEKKTPAALSKKPSSSKKIALASTVKVFAPTKKQTPTFLMQTDVDLASDVATVGQVAIHKHGNLPVGLDLKGTMYRGVMNKCNTFAMIEMAGESCKITHVANTFLDIVQTVSMVEAENVYEGEVDLFDMDDFVDSEQITKKKPNAKAPSKKLKRKTSAKKTPAKKPKK